MLLDQVPNQTFGIAKTTEFNKRSLIPYLVISGVLSAIFLTIACIDLQLEHFYLAAGFLLTFIFGILFFFGLLKIPNWLSIIFFTILLELSIDLLSSIYPSFFGIPYILIAIAAGFLLSNLLPESRANDWINTIAIISAISIYQLNVVSPFAQFSNSTIVWIVVAVAIVIVTFTVVQLIRRKLIASLRTKLIIGSMALSLIPLIMLSVINNQYIENLYREQTIQNLTTESKQTAQSIDDFITSTKKTLEVESKLAAIQDYLRLDPTLRADSTQEIQLRSTLRSLQTKSEKYPPSYAILDLEGDNLFDTNILNLGKSESATDYFINASFSDMSFVSTINFPDNSEKAYINFISPIKNPASETLGYLRARYDAAIFQDLIDESMYSADAGSYPILVNENGLRLADKYSPDQIYHSLINYSDDQYTQLINSNKLPKFISRNDLYIPQNDIERAISTLSSGEFFSTKIRNQDSDVSYAGTIVKLSTKLWTLVYLQDQTPMTTAIAAQNALNSTITTTVAVIIGILIAVVANLFLAPILRLTEAAGKISAGDLNAQVKITSQDELGILGNAFNSMTRQLKDFIDTLEKRVDERTRQLAEQNESLQFRSRQLQTVAEVARNIVSTREVDALLTNVTQLVSERFGFYHVGVFLLDETGDYAVLRAANSEGGQRMLARQHRLRVGQVGIVGYATGTGEPRIATDVGEDAVYFNNPDLPQTKSEMALPLKLGNKVIGALDIQSTKSNAFTEEDIELFNTLANQIAVAINNNQLFEETTKALEETQNLYRQYLRQEWTRQTSDGGNKNYKFTSEGLIPYEEDLPEVNMVLNTGRPVFRTQKSESDGGLVSSVMAVPILLSGESIGAIYLQEKATHDYIWSQSELATVQAVADQVAQTLENARLFEQTLRRADRERKVLEITSKIRSTNDPQEMLKITLEELKKNLGAKQAQIVLNIDSNSTGDFSSVQSTSFENPTPSSERGIL